MDFNYEDSRGSKIICCKNCKYVFGKDGKKHYGVLKSKSIIDKDFGKLVLFCNMKKTYVKPVALCDEFRLSERRVKDV